MYALPVTHHRPRSLRRPRSPWPGRLRNGALIGTSVLALSLGFARIAEGGAPAAYEVVTVEPGDTLWSIAGDRYPGTDVRAKIYQIEQANHRHDAHLVPGETIRVPSR